MTTVNGAAELAALAAKLKAAGMGGLKLEMTRGVRAAAQPLLPKLRAAAAADLPKAGGLAVRVSQQPIKVSVRTSPRSAGVSIRAPYTGTNRGSWRHPVFGRNVWVEQTFGPAAGWFDKTGEDDRPEIRAAIEAVLVGVRDKIVGL